MDIPSLAAVAAFTEQALDHLLQQSLYAAAVAAVVWTVLAIVKPRHPFLHLALWWFVLARLVLPADLSTSWSLRSSAETLMAHVVWPEGEPRINVVGAKTQVTPQEARRSVGVATAPAETAQATPASPVISPRKVEATAAPEAPAIGWVPMLVFIFWLGGVAGMTVLLVRAERGARLSVAMAEPANAPLLEQLVDAWRQRFGISRPVQLLITNQATAPFTTGIRRPVIVLPRQLLDRLDEADVSAIIGHEMSHIRSFDVAWRFAERVLLVLFFFHPLVWMAVRRIDTAREACCDLAAAHSGVVDRPAYAKGLLAALKAFRIEPDAAFAQTLSIVGGSGNSLKDRLTWLKGGTSMSKSSKIIGGIGLVGLGLLVLPMAQAHNGSDEPVAKIRAVPAPPAAPKAPPAPAAVSAVAAVEAPEAPLPPLPPVPAEVDFDADFDPMDGQDIDAMVQAQLAAAEKGLRQTEQHLARHEKMVSAGNWNRIVIHDEKGLRCSADLLNKPSGVNGKVCVNGLTNEDKRRIIANARQAVKEAKTGYAEAMHEARRDIIEAQREAQFARQEAQRDAAEARREALQAAAEARREALEAQQERRQALREASKSLREAARNMRTGSGDTEKAAAALDSAVAELAYNEHAVRTVDWDRIASALEDAAKRIEQNMQTVGR